MHNLATCAAVLLAATAAATAQPFTYQGELVNAGVPANGAHDFEFRVFNTAVGGTQQGVVTDLSPVEVVDGRFTVEINPGPGIFEGADRWLEIRVRPYRTGSYVTLTPRHRVTPTPYSIRSLKEWLQPVGISSLRTDPARDRLLINRSEPLGNTEFFGITTPTSAGEFGGMIINAQSATGRPYYGYALSGSLISWTYTDGPTNQWRLNHAGDRIAVTTSGNVGIGTINPAARLHVSGNARADNFVYDQPPVRYLSLPPSAFRPRSTTAEANIESGTGSTFYTGTGNFGNFLVPLNLPDGAVITNVTVWILDNSPAVDVTATILSRVYIDSFFTSMGNATTSGSNSNPQVVSFTPSATPVDNFTRAYILSIFCPTWQGSATAIKGARITYTVTQPD